ncbi:hypothetical protein B1987_02930 [Mycobacterium kansasii]|uniref:Uncharacterized protein n=1 Tax=Mycobacterium attenuatum TaxID=2341086 RepID=A0A498Q454_9MYCO|nr:hypothetical protein [Mycobacterium attenuatum]ORB82963.1 hypothetical protein B1987_02930 [Mycobacterium kansasii]VBA40137.1 hypothetical protein LAUMK136_03353 [Mycobacterium attenuatum]VBA55302.1 hypothetical protein LAUMK191_03320 [Mycobacterium attenuatum]VBA59288.1 hypothetical protein LAUMK41_03413 [Mycobacterium attenuatum]
MSLTPPPLGTGAAATGPASELPNPSWIAKRRAARSAGHYGQAGEVWWMLAAQLVIVIVLVVILVV